MKKKAKSIRFFSQFCHLEGFVICSGRHIPLKQVKLILTFDVVMNLAKATAGCLLLQEGVSAFEAGTRQASFWEELFKETENVFASYALVPVILVFIALIGVLIWESCTEEVIPARTASVGRTLVAGFRRRYISNEGFANFGQIPTRVSESQCHFFTHPFKQELE